MSNGQTYFFYGILLFVQVLFGLNFSASKIVVGAIDPTHWAFFRFFVAGLILLVTSAILFRGKGEWNLKYFFKILLLSFWGVALSQGAFMHGIYLTSSINTAIICSLIPVFTLLIVIIKGQERLTWKRGVGFSLALLGVVVIRKFEQLSFSNTTFIGDLLILASVVGTSVFISYGRGFLQQHNHWWASAWLFLFGSMQLLFLALLEGSAVKLPELANSPLVISMCYTVIGATLLTYFLSNWALVHVDSGKVSLFIYLQPVVASMVAWGYLGESVTIRSLLSCGLILMGFLLGLGGSRRQKRDNYEVNSTV
ncbi:MAG: DMT family transporter [Bdellovibrionales bacterium]|nr:DMT family transporter [Bdellovibrionales bacterium]MBT3525363.1 DMT family transporter [Bdellovibrionales bacterium]MBT7669141.1 DMT family transporter [Bdellovibrionales bacterium]MBT7766618.1 DMT family transporter [Bdellovibrionales bacterium]